MCNIDSASKGNPGDNAYGFCIRNCERNLIYVEAQCFGIGNSLEAEAKAINIAL